MSGVGEKQAVVRSFVEAWNERAFDRLGEPIGDDAVLHVGETAILRIAAGRIVEAWEVYDDAGMWRRLGASAPV